MYSLLYDGVIYPRATRQVRVKKPIDVYVNLLGATTPQYLFENLDPKFFFQGVGNRVDFEIPNIEYEYKTSEELHPGVTGDDLDYWKTHTLSREQEKFGNMLINMIKIVNMKENLILELTPDARDRSREYYNQKQDEKEEYGEHDQFAYKCEYINRDWQKSLKYAGIIALSGYKVFDKDEISLIFVDEKAVEGGQKVVEHNLKQFEKLHEKWMTYAREKEGVTENTTRIAMKYLAVIEERKLVS